MGLVMANNPMNMDTACENEKPDYGQSQHVMNQNIHNRNGNCRPSNNIQPEQVIQGKGFKSDCSDAEDNKNTLNLNPQDLKGKVQRRRQRKKSVVSYIMAPTPFLDDGIKFGESVVVKAKEKKNERSYSKNLRNLFNEPSQFVERINFAPKDLCRQASGDFETLWSPSAKQDTSKSQKKKKRYSLGIHQIHQATPSKRNQSKRKSNFSRKPPHNMPVTPDSKNEPKATNGSDQDKDQDNDKDSISSTHTVKYDLNKTKRRTDRRTTAKTGANDGQRSEDNKFENCKSDQFSNDSEFFEDAQANVVIHKGKEIDIGTNTMVTSFQDRMYVNEDLKKVQRQKTINILKHKKTLVQFDSDDDDSNPNIKMKKRHSLGITKMNNHAMMIKRNNKQKRSTFKKPDDEGKPMVSMNSDSEDDKPEPLEEKPELIEEKPESPKENPITTTPVALGMPAMFMGRGVAKKMLGINQSVNDRISLFTAALALKKATLANFNPAYNLGVTGAKAEAGKEVDASKIQDGVGADEGKAQEDPQAAADKKKYL